MKRILLVLSLIIGVAVSAQQNLLFEIQHTLNGQAFTPGDQGQNNMGDDFNVYRLEYYISRIALIHDGGQEIELPDTYLLVDGSQTFSQSLGSFSITQLEAVRFAIGVDSARNYLDPASWPMAHPLAPKSPSMHWGWTAGYRFAVMEGNSGVGLGQNYEFHALGGKNFTYQTIQTNGVSDNGDLVIRLFADYAEAFYNIPLDQGMIQHGQDDEAAEFLGNFSVRVFKSSEGNGPVASILEQDSKSVRVFPNPAARQVKVDASDLAASIDRFEWVNNQGATLASGKFSEGGIETPAVSGIYFLNLYSGSTLVAVKKVLVQR